MRKLIYSMTVSLDGFIAGPDGAIDWSVPDEELFLSTPSRCGNSVCTSADRGLRNDGLLGDR